MMTIATTGIAGRPAAKPMPSDPKRALFARHPFFAALSPAEYERVFARAHAKAFARGEAIFAKGDPGQSLRNTTEQVEDLMFLDLPGRLAKTLLRLCETDPRAAVRLTQRELGEIVGISRERINKQLRAWAQKRWIELEKGGVVVRNPAALARYAID